MAKTKISVTVDSRLVEQVDALDIDASRSEVVEMALEHWLRSRRLEALDRGVEEYYRNLTPREQEEDAEWAALAADAVDDAWS